MLLFIIIINIPPVIIGDKPCFRSLARAWLSPEGTKADAPDHVEKRVKYEQTQQQVEEHGLLGWIENGA